TQLLAGTDADGDPILYNTVESLVVNKARIKSLKTMFISRNPNIYTGGIQPLVTAIYDNPNPDLQNEVSGTKENRWALFGQDQYDLAGRQRTMVNSQIGFMLASPTLYMLEGKREVEIKMRFRKEEFANFWSLIESIAHDNKTLPGISPDAAFFKIFSTGFFLRITTPDGWMKIENYVPLVSQENSTIAFCFELAVTDPAIVSYDPEVHGGSYPTQWPLLEVVLNPEAWVYPYSLIQVMTLRNIMVKVQVQGIRNLVVNNPQGQVSTDDAFPPFGSDPEVGTSFLIGSSEAFEKQLTNIKLMIEWDNLPTDEEGFYGYFSGYDVEINNSDYHVSLSRLNDREWVPIPSVRQEFELFETKPGYTLPDQPLVDRTVIKGVDMDKIAVQASYQFTDELVYNSSTASGFISLTLTSPPFAFGQDDYANRLAEVLLINANNTLKNRDNKKIVIVPEPNPPFVPMVSRLTLNYTASSTLFPQGQKGHMLNTGDDQLFHIEPFGYQELDISSPELMITLLPNFNPVIPPGTEERKDWFGFNLMESASAGYLMMGVEGARKDDILAFYFQISEGVANRSLDLDRTTSWQYLYKGDWVSLPDQSVLSDGTDNFVRSGIIRVKLMFEQSLLHTSMPTGMLWLRITMTPMVGTGVRAYDINLQGVQAQWSSNNPDHMAQEDPLPPNSITSLANIVPEIETVNQPFASFSGILPETIVQYHERVSERLRHKNRAITPWDYEHLVLQAFPIVSQVKCFSACVDSKQQKPGNVLIAVLGNAFNSMVRNPYRPKLTLSMLTSIRDFLAERCSEFVTLEVRNPSFERVRVICTVRFKEGVDEG
ncbi:MAG: hypothetical protein AAGB22_05195, partial [Bacteroidota bacterium]